MIVLLIAALAIAALLLVGGNRIARSRARERQRRERLDSARQAAAIAEARAQEERHRASADASDALTSVMPAIKLPWPTQPPGSPRSDGYQAFDNNYPEFSALAPFHAEEWPADHSAAGQIGAAGYPGEYAGPPGHAGERTGPGTRPAEYAVPNPRAGEHDAQADRPRKRAGQGSHRGGHAKRRRG